MATTTVSETAIKYKSAERIQKRQLQHDLAVECLSLLKQPIFQLIAGVAAAEAAEKAGIIEEPWTAIVQTSVIAYGMAELFGKAGPIGGLAALGTAGFVQEAATAGFHSALRQALFEGIFDVDLLQKLPGGSNRIMRTISDYLPLL
jgi:hypothetical protein